MLGGLREQPDKIDRIALENVRIGDSDAVILDAEVGSLAHLAARAPGQRIEYSP